MYICHIFTHSSVSAHLSCFHVLATVRSAAMNTGVLFKLCVLNYGFLRVYALVGLLDHIHC